MGVRSGLGIVGVWEELVYLFAGKRKVENLRVLTFAWDYVAY